MKNSQDKLLNKIRIIFAITYSFFLVVSFYISFFEISDLFLNIPISIIIGIIIGYYIVFNSKLFLKCFEPIKKSYKAFLIVMFLMVIINSIFFAVMTGDVTIYGASFWPATFFLGAIRGFIFSIIFGIAVRIIRKPYLRIKEAEITGVRPQL